jgi:hypothetical protein
MSDRAPQSFAAFSRRLVGSTVIVAALLLAGVFLPGGTLAAAPGPAAPSAPGPAAPSAPGPAAPSAPGPAAPSAAVWMQPVVTSTQPGVTLTQDTAEPWFVPASVSNAQSILGQATQFVNVSIMGWGVGNPEPSPGVFDWSDLDQRIEFIEASGVTPVITLAGAPDWMKGGVPGTTNWSLLDVAPLPQYYGAFAQLAVAVAQRYPQVKYFQVWNELKGFWNYSSNTWDIQDYTTFYNDVYEALKAYNPSLQVGGPYASITTWAAPTAGGHPSSLVGAWGTVDQRSLDAISYWLSHAVGADFLAVDATTETEDGATLADPFGATQLFLVIDQWLRARTSLPIWWSEWYADTPQLVDPSSPEWSAMSAEALLQITISGASVALMWNPEQFPGTATPGIWTSTQSSPGGAPTALTAEFEVLHKYFPPGTHAELSALNPSVLQLSADGHFVAINISGSSTTVQTLGGKVTMSAWQVIAQ